MASNQPHTKRDVGGQGDKTGKASPAGNPPKNQPGKGSSDGAKGKNESGGKR